MKERRPVFLSVHQRGIGDFSRYFLSDQFNRVWSGHSWSEDHNEAILFAKSNDACAECQRLLMLEYLQLPVRRFKAPVYLDLFCDHEISQDQLVKWLAKVSKLLIDSLAFGNGPVEGSLGVVNIRWSELREVKK